MRIWPQRSATWLVASNTLIFNTFDRHFTGNTQDSGSCRRLARRCDVPCWRLSAEAVMLDSWQRFV